MATEKLVTNGGWSSIETNYLGKYMDHEGRGLTGFLREYKQSYQVVVLNKGHPCR